VTTAVVQPTVEAAPRARTAADRMLAAVPLATVFLWACLIFAYQAWAHRTPWLFSDEIEYTDISRAIAATGHPAIRGVPHSYDSLYVYMLAPVWWIHSTAAAYAVAKDLGVVVMASAIFPTYALARMLVRPTPALVAATLTVVAPALSYSAFLVTEPLAYPWAALAFWLIVKALVTRRWPWIVGAAVITLSAGRVRNELSLIVPVALAAALWYVWTSEPLATRRRRWKAWQWAVTAAVGAVLGYLAYRAAVGHSPQLHLAFVELPHRTLRYGVWAAGAFAIGLGVLPVVAGLTTLVRPGAPRTPASRAFVGLFASAIVAFCLYAAVKATYLSTVFAIRVEERNLFYLVPLVAVAFAVWLDRPRVNLFVLAVVGAAVGYLLAATPYQLGQRPYSDAPGLAALTWLNRTFRWNDGQIRTALYCALGVSLLLVAAASFERLGRVARPVLAVASLLVLSWTLAGELSAANGSNSLAKRFYYGVQHPLDWIDQSTGGAHATYIGTGITDGTGVWEMEFWNRSLRHVASLDGSAPGPGTVIRPTVYRPDGAVLNDPGTPYVVADAGVDVAGKVVRRNGPLTLLRVGTPLRMRSAVTGVSSDGWTGVHATFARYAVPAAQSGVLRIRLSRQNWQGPNVPGHVTLRIGTLVPPTAATVANPCWDRSKPCKSLDPTIGKVTAVRRWTASSGAVKLIAVRVRTPFLVDVTVDPTFSPAQFGLYDTRQLGVQPTFSFTPDRR
jgi:hypothetical protein